jgi:hypothetical protein
MASVGNFITLVQAVETAYPEWTTDRLITNIRHIGPLDGPLFQQLLGTTPGIDIQPRGNLSQTKINALITELNHTTTTNQETGISQDSATGRNVAIGHVIVGISAGIHHPPPVIFVDVGPARITLPDLSISKQRLGLDPLYTTTITGDLGQTATIPNTLCSESRCVFGGVGSEATAAELNGDIDGFLLGYWLSTTSAGQAYRSTMVRNGSGARLSTMLTEYYRTRTDRPINMIAGSGYPLESTRRFSNFRPTLQTLRISFIDQTASFNSYFAALNRRIPDSSRSLRAFADFVSWCDRGGV